MLSLVVGPKVEPVSLDEARLHCKVDDGFEDALIQAWIRAAREHVEQFTGRALITQTWDLKLDAFPCGAIWLPKPPVSAVSSITYIGTDGIATAWSSSLYDTDLPSGPEAARARIEPAYGQTYPSTRDVLNAVVVRFVCGYGAAAANVPAAIKAAMLLLIGHWHVHREATIVGTSAVELPMAVSSLLWPYRVW